jgi:hypothetical protein
MSKGAFEVIVFHFMEAVHVELSYEAVHFFMAEVAGKHDFFEFNHIFDDEFETVAGPVHYLLVFLDLNGVSYTFSISKVLKTNPATSGSSGCRG